MVRNGILVRLPTSTDQQKHGLSNRNASFDPYLSIFRLTSKKEFTEHFRKGNISAPIQPERWIGIKPGVNESWEHFGLNFAVIITAVTAIIIFFQVIRQEELHWINGLKYRSGHQP